LIENLRGLLDRYPDELFDVLQILKESGYCVTWDIVNTAHHGIPQSRPRLFIVAIREDACAGTFSSSPRSSTSCPPLTCS
jgi:DNA (cytosine-5)-methyltransferase 1